MPTRGQVFSTPRLLVRRLSLADMPLYAALEGNAEVMRYVTGRPRSFTESRDRLLCFIREYATNPPHVGLWAVVEKASGLYIGTASINPLPNSTLYQIGYKLHPGAQGKGYATELACQLLKQGFFRALLPRLAAVTHPANLASQRVLCKAGLQREGFHFAYGENLHFFSLDKQQYVERLQKRG
ncbi:GNAT family N-acetyltransferase [Cesiribacter andamanensis]|uniref:Anhydro-N-acetylmuramic acid kinase n=1 Tax=Cesiribacter andamanensis AMV16 TaxID=1279009 RepID=M7P2Q0_9BACT|nr:GNAT family N-acetyltransferase [Cesiribacter andamanensis]EMR04824.1 anhydro-N-acetylmuramic acid kinase [Cesiribacter andamanensis AMV16]